MLGDFGVREVDNEHAVLAGPGRVLGGGNGLPVVGGEFGCAVRFEIADIDVTAVEILPPSQEIVLGRR